MPNRKIQKIGNTKGKYKKNTIQKRSNSTAKTQPQKEKTQQITKPNRK